MFRWFSMWEAASDARIDHLFGLRVEGEQLPMCELARVVRRTPADAAWCCLVGAKGLETRVSTLVLWMYLFCHLVWTEGGNLGRSQ